MSGQSQHLNVVPSVTMLGAMKARLVGATRGHPLLKKKSDALTMQFRQILKKIVSTKESMGEVMKTSSFALTEAKNVAGENIKHIVLENVQNASLKVRSKQENIAGVKLPKFEYFTKGETKNDLTGLARGGQQVQICRAAYVKQLRFLLSLPHCRHHCHSLGRHQLVSDAAAAHCQTFDSSFWDDSIVTELNQPISLRCQKLKKRKNSEDDSVGPLTTNVSAKYVIIEEDEHDDGA